MRLCLFVMLICMLVLASAATPVSAQSAPGVEVPLPVDSARTVDRADVPHPVPPPPDRRWPGVMLIVILGLFLAAAVIGPIVRAELPEELPQTHTHDEPPGASRHHGRSGTLHDE